MAIRNIRTLGDEALYKVCKPVTEMTKRLSVMIDDMFDTMYESGGVGLAAPQIGARKRVFVIDVGLEDPDPHVFINPEILEIEGEQTGSEGCLSVPGKHGVVTRPQKVKVRALDRDMNEFTLEAEGLFARAVCHEYDHLDGHLYTELVEGPLMDDAEREEE